MIYQGDQTREISFPIGGIGTGSIGLGGNGRLLDWEIQNKPNKGSINGMSHFAIKAVQDGKVLGAKVLQGDLNKDLNGQYLVNIPFRGFGHGPLEGTMAGFPHFEHHQFDAVFPVANVHLSDGDFPGCATVTAFNPFIPLDDENSSLPAAFFEITVKNTTDRSIEYTIGFSAQNLAVQGSVNRFTRYGKYSMIDLLTEGGDQNAMDYGQMTMATDADDVSYQEYWYRGEWFDYGTVYWQNFIAPEKLNNRHYDTPGSWDKATLAVAVNVQAHEERKVRFLLSWYYPNCQNYLNVPDDPNCKNAWKNYYATRFASSAEVAKHCMEHWTMLSEKTNEFLQSMLSMSLPRDIVEGILANLSVLKSPTVWRLEDGSFYGWEGVHEKSGSCEGSCQHVWNYAYALPFLFPKLERSMRELDFKYNLRDDGMMGFRLILPLGREPWWWPCVDGQMGAVIKTYREWKLCGDDEWLKKLWPDVKKAMHFAWRSDNPFRWDADKDGVLDGRQHHTLDMELYGPSSWLQSFYLAALKAAAEMAEYLDEANEAEEFRRVYEQGRKWSEENLFNGEYFFHKVDLTDESILLPYTEDAHRRYWNTEGREIKYQIGEGCFSDQICGQWHAKIAGLGEIFDTEKVQSALKSIFRYNFIPKIRNHFNPCRNYCLNDEGGMVNCVYPESANKPIIPVPYCQECFTGFEYEVASHMVGEGMLEEGFSIFRAARERYDGAKRNPWNEIECGSNYARQMSSYALIPIYSGFRFDLPRGEIGFNPVVQDRPFSSVWSVDGAWGTVEIGEEETVICLKGGRLNLKKLVLPYVPDGHVQIMVDGAVHGGKCENGVIQIRNVPAQHRITIRSM